jgi:hypothetical protein
MKFQEMRSKTSTGEEGRQAGSLKIFDFRLMIENIEDCRLMIVVTLRINHQLINLQSKI